MNQKNRFMSLKDLDNRVFPINVYLVNTQAEAPSVFEVSLRFLRDEPEAHMVCRQVYQGHRAEKRPLYQKLHLSVLLVLSASHQQIR